MAQTRWIAAGQIECSKSDGSTCAVQVERGEIFSRAMDGNGEDWTDNEEQQLLLDGKHVNELPDGRYQVAGTGEILTPIRKPR